MRLWLQTGLRISGETERRRSGVRIALRVGQAEPIDCLNRDGEAACDPYLRLDLMFTLAPPSRGSFSLAVRD
jgi:hypothetical protein